MCNIIIYGTGAIGSMLAALMKASFPEQNSIHLIGRDRILSQFQEKGLVYIPYHESDESNWLHLTNFKYHTDVPSDISFDIVFLTMKAHALRESLDKIQPQITPNSRIVIAMNGLGLREIVEEFVQPSQIIEMVMNFPTKLVENRVYNDGGNSHLVVAENKENREFFAQIFRPEIFELTFSTDFHLSQWKKGLMNIGMNAISAITMLTVGEVLARSTLKPIILALIQETIAIARKEGVDYDVDMVDFFWNFAGKDPNHYTSTYYDLVNSKPSEIPFFNGFISKKGEEYHIPTPANDAIAKLAKIIESK